MCRVEISSIRRRPSPLDVFGDTAHRFATFGRNIAVVLPPGDRPLLDAPLLGAADMALTELVEKKMDYELIDPIANEIKYSKNPEGAKAGE